MPTAPIPIATYLASLTLNFYDLANVRTTGDAVIQVAGGNGAVNIPIAQGVQGFSVYGGTTVPTATSPAAAVAMDQYIYAGTGASTPIVVAPGDVLRKVADNSWSVIGNVRGAQGLTGNTGNTGATGPSSGILTASDYDDSVAPTAGAIPEWNGTKFAPRNHGVVARARRTTSAVSTAASTVASAQRVMALSAPIVAGRLYEISAPNVAMYSTGSGTFGVTTAQAFLTYITNPGGGYPAVTDAQLTQALVQPNSNGQPLPAPLTAFYTPTASGPLGVLLAYFQPVGSGSLGVTMVGSTSEPIDLLVKDIGVDPGPSGASY